MRFRRLLNQMANVKGKIGRIHNEFGVFNFRFDRKQVDRLRKIAESEHRTVTQKLRQMIDDEIEHAERGQKALAAAEAIVAQPENYSELVVQTAKEALARGDSRS